MAMCARKLASWAGRPDSLVRNVSSPVSPTPRTRGSPASASISRSALSRLDSRGASFGWIATAGLALRVRHEGVWYPAEEVAKGAAYELFAPRPETGFLVNPRPGAQYPYRCFVHATEVEAVSGPVTEAHDGPLHAPVSRVLDWRAVHRMSQAPAGEDSAVAAIRRTATVRRGTRMLKVLSARQLAGYLRGWLPCGFCYREYDLAHLRT